MDPVGQSTRSKRSHLDSAMYSSAETAALFDIGYTTLNEMVKAGTFPITPVKIGRQYKFPKRTVDHLLGLDDTIEGGVA